MAPVEPEQVRRWVNEGVRHALSSVEDFSAIELELIAQARIVRDFWQNAADHDFAERLAFHIDNDPRVRWANDAIVD